MTLLSAGTALIISLAATPLAPGLAAAAWAAGDTACRVGDERLVEISGLVADRDGYVVVNDGADDAAGRRIFYLNRNCKVVRTVAYPSRPRDTEDLARDADGTLWVGDIGDNGQNRDDVGVWRLAPGASAPTLFRLSYPDGAHDAEALLVGGDGIPIVVTKDPFTAGVYVPAGPLRAGATTPLRRAGDFAIPVTATSNPFGFKGRLVVTGGAVSPDGRRAALRTYADAFEFDVPGGDGTGAGPTADALVGAITGGAARTIALPDEPQGESLAYSADGSALLTVSEMTGQAKRADLLRYPRPDAAPQPAVTSSTASGPPSSGTAPAASSAAGSRLPLGAIVAGVALAAAAGAIGLLVARRSRRH
ncbi:hypothetical protein [Actinoplanes utahensis]|uniref:Esterase-like activity of phytase family protein n=1 Tax=Actinoplanes utahensis TaxID=1869 RepID=A0A0A6UQV6_ACTUT|nr:hypothetical protein [Actinoplanes utahensis]KHD77423.1 hypothetical protein MB27_11885 [Actinoplanes utahensis]GIF32800.1 hypothetical protein Aut01nite_57860 [Actinoplanes utahensis]